ncbi:MAG TPA: RagB/SusD family nutrient uptake outer membrane protein [Sphingobacteriaceae bacterium]|nr:RagB/SusD family nutrient uptake outer membrane protein [Sphingobacteriaceae bacterium]
MMRIIYCILILQAFLLVGCKNDPLDITPDGRISIADVFKDKRLTEAYVNSIYGHIRLYGGRYYPNVMLASFSDEAHGSDHPQDSWSQVSQWYNGMLTPSYNPLDAGANREDGIKWNGQYWEDGWSAIRQANTFLDEIFQTDDDIIPYDEKARLIAEVKLLRAYFYLELIKMYGGMPVVPETFSSEFDFTNLERNSFAECVDFIVQDCNDALAEDNLPYRIVNEGERGRFTKAVAHAIKSEATLFNASPLWNPEGQQAKWAAAAAAGKDAIAELEAVGYKLFDDYEKYFQGNSSNSNDWETIFEIKNPSAVYEGSLFFLNGIPAVGAALAGSTPSQELVDSYDMSNGEIPILGYYDDEHLEPIINTQSGYSDATPYIGRDPRFYASVWYNQAYYGNIYGREHWVESFYGGQDGIANLRQRTHNGYYLRKFNDPSLRVGNVGNLRWKRYRYAEILLNYAEAENEASGPIGDVYNAINAVRFRANMPDLPLGLTKEEMRERIRRERRVEMAFEEKRFWDVRRWKILAETDRISTGMGWTHHGGGVMTNERIVVAERRSWEDRFLIFPIPVLEMSRLPRFYQNPGW